MCMKLIVLLAIAAICQAQYSGNPDGGPGEVGDVIYYKTFNDGSLAEWNGNAITQNHATIVNNGFNGQKALKLTAPTKGNYFLTNEVENPYWAKGTTIRISATVKAENVSVPSQTYLGIKFMLVTTTYDGVKNYPQKTRVWGTFDWNTTVVDKDIYIESTVQSMYVSISLQDSTGTIYVDHVKIVIIAAPPVVPASALWNLSSSCITIGPGIVKPVVNCEITNIPTGFTLPNTFQIKIGTGSENLLTPDSWCRPQFLAGSPANAFCDATAPTATGTRNYPLYVRNSITQNWIRTKNIVTTYWAI